MILPNQPEQLIGLTPYAYVASPYSLYPGGLDNAHKAAARVAGGLLKLGVYVYAPIAHCHPIADSAQIPPRDHAIWLLHCRAMFDPCAALIIAMLDGWRESYGIGEEIKWAKEAKKPIYWMEPRTFTWSRAAQ